MLRVVEEVVLKYSWNLDAEPEVAAVAAAVASLLQLLRAVRIAVRRVPEQSLWTAVRLVRDCRAVSILAVFAASTSIESWLLQ